MGASSSVNSGYSVSPSPVYTFSIPSFTGYDIDPNVPTTGVPVIVTEGKPKITCNECAGKGKILLLVNYVECNKCDGKGTV